MKAITVERILELLKSGWHVLAFLIFATVWITDSVNAVAGHLDRLDRRLDYLQRHMIQEDEVMRWIMKHEPAYQTDDPPQLDNIDPERERKQAVPDSEFLVPPLEGQNDPFDAAIPRNP